MSGVRPPLGLAARTLTALILVALIAFGLIAFLILHASRVAIAESEEADVVQRATTLGGLLELDPQVGVELELPGSALPDYFGEAPLAFFRIIHLGSGDVVAESPGAPAAILTGGEDAGLDQGAAPTTRETSFGGRAYRIVALRAVPQGEGGWELSAQQLAAEACLVIVGLDRAPGVAQQSALASLILPILVVGLGLIITGSAFALRWGLGSIRRLSTEVATLDSQDLREIALPDVREVAAVATGLNQLIRGLRAARARERRFLADSTHELRTPLTEIRTTAEVALRTLPAASSSRRDMEDVHAAALRMQSTVDAILALARAEAAQECVPIERVALRPLIEEAWKRQRESAERRALTLRPQGVGSPEIETSRDWIRRVVDNLVSNVVEHAPGGDEVWYGLEAAEGGFVFWMENSAPDLSADDVPHLFERFWQKDAARSDSHSGLGLAVALAVSRQLSLALQARLSPQGRLRVTLATAIQGGSARDDRGRSGETPQP